MARKKEGRPKDDGRMIVEIARPAAVRWLVILCLGAMGALLLAMSVSIVARQPFVALALFAAALALLYLGLATLRSGASRLRFDGQRLTDDSGVELCRLEEIETVERGFVLLKPSTGFLITLKAPRPFAWAPGLWWRWGRKIGVGGATSRAAGKMMAEAISLALAQRPGG